jgi:hypothetical protein
MPVDEIEKNGTNRVLMMLRSVIISGKPPTLGK